jgi:hypothetical protein
VLAVLTGYAACAAGRDYLMETFGPLTKQELAFLTQVDLFGQLPPSISRIATWCWLQRYLAGMLHEPAERRLHGDEPPDKRDLLMRDKTALTRVGTCYQVLPVHPSVTQHVCRLLIPTCGCHQLAEER